MVWIAWTGLHLVRYALRSEPSPLAPWSTETALVLLAQGLVFWRVGLYRGIWRFASVPDFLNILKACLFGLVMISVGLFLYNRMRVSCSGVKIEGMKNANSPRRSTS